MGCSERFPQQEERFSMKKGRPGLTGWRSEASEKTSTIPRRAELGMGAAEEPGRGPATDPGAAQHAGRALRRHGGLVRGPGRQRGACVRPAACRAVRG